MWSSLSANFSRKILFWSKFFLRFFQRSEIQVSLSLPQIVSGILLWSGPCQATKQKTQLVLKISTPSTLHLRQGMIKTQSAMGFVPLNRIQQGLKKAPGSFHLSARAVLLWDSAWAQAVKTPGCSKGSRDFWTEKVSKSLENRVVLKQFGITRGEVLSLCKTMNGNSDYWCPSELCNQQTTAEGPWYYSRRVLSDLVLVLKVVLSY